jgi:glucose-6-phosphate 1-dehydrogenase
MPSPSTFALRRQDADALDYLFGQVEKPFGKDLESSRELQKALAPNWKEEEVFRIDHYLGKEMVKNILILRFGNEFFGATWNRQHIDNVQV